MASGKQADQSALAGKACKSGQEFVISQVNPKLKEYNRPFLLAVLIGTPTLTLSALLLYNAVQPTDEYEEWSSNVDNQLYDTAKKVLAHSPKSQEEDGIAGCMQTFGVLKGGSMGGDEFAQDIFTIPCIMQNTWAANYPNDPGVEYCDGYPGSDEGLLPCESHAMHVAMYRDTGDGNKWKDLLGTNPKFTAHQIQPSDGKCIIRYSVIKSKPGGGAQMPVQENQCYLNVADRSWLRNDEDPDSTFTMPYCEGYPDQAFAEWPADSRAVAMQNCTDQQVHALHIVKSVRKIVVQSSFQEALGSTLGLMAYVELFFTIVIVGALSCCGCVKSGKDGFLASQLKMFAQETADQGMEIAQEKVEEKVEEVKTDAMGQV